jgi:hypothetical protein
LLADVGIERGGLQGRRRFGERFLCPRSVSGGRAKGRGKRLSWAIYRRDFLRRGLGFCGSGGDGRRRESRACPGLLDGGRRRLTPRAGVSAIGGVPIRDPREAGPWAPFWTRLKSFPAALSSFSLFPSLFFLRFSLFLLYYLQI